MAIGEASVRIVPDLSGFAQQVTKDVNAALDGIDKTVKETTDNIEDEFQKAGKEAGEAANNIGSEFKKLGKLIAGAAVGRAVFNFAKSSIDAASDLGESINAVQVTFGELSDQILEFSKTSARSVGLASADFNSFAVRFAGFTKQIATGTKNAATVTEELTTRIADFASVMNLDLNEAATVFASTLAGESEAIRRFGIDMSAASIEAFALANGMIANKNEMTAAIKVQATYAKLMADTAQVAGDFANTSDSLANRQRILAAEFKNMQAQVGAALMPVLNDLLGVAGSLVSAFTQLPEGLQKAITFAGLAAGAFVALSSALQGVGLAAKTANLYVAGFMAVATLGVMVLSQMQRNAADARARQQELNTALQAANDPTLQLVDQMKNLIKTYNELNPEEATDGINQMVGAVDFTKAQVLDFLPVLKDAGVSLQDLTAEVATGTDGFAKLINPLSNSADFAELMSANTDELAHKIKRAGLEGSTLAPILMDIAKNGGLTRGEFIELLTVLDSSADAFDDQREETNKLSKEMLTSVDGVRALSGILGDDLYGVLVRNADEMANNAGRTDEWTWLLEEVARRAEALGYELDTTTGEIVATEGALNDAGDAADSASTQMSDYAKGLGFVVDESGNVEASQENMERAIELAQERFDSAVEAVEDYKDAIEDAFDAARSSIDTGFALVEAQAEATESLKEYNKIAKSSKTSTSELDEAARNTAKSMLEVADRAVENARALAETQNSTLDAARAQEIYRENLLGFMETLSPTSPLYQYLNGFLDTLDGVPTEIPIELQTEVDTAQRELEGFQNIAKDMGFTIGAQITKGILEALAPLSPQFGMLLQEMSYLETKAQRLRDLSVLPTVKNPKTLSDISPYLSFANGGIFDQPQFGLFAEAGAEAIIPLTRPARALELMRESGLLGLAQSASGSQNFDIKVVSAEPMRTARDVVREFQAVQYRMGPI